jgi:hypothetical protein
MGKRKKSIPGKTPKEVVFQPPCSINGYSGFGGLLGGRFGAEDPLGEQIVLGWTPMCVYFQPPEGQKVSCDQQDTARDWGKSSRGKHADGGIFPARLGE